MAKSFFLPDTLEYTRYKTGKDCSGICNALSSFVTKLTTSVSPSPGLFILNPRALLLAYPLIGLENLSGLASQLYAPACWAFTAEREKISDFDPEKWV